MGIREFYQIGWLVQGLRDGVLALLCVAAVVWWRSHKAPVTGLLAAAAVCALAHATWDPLDIAGLVGLLVPSWQAPAVAWVVKWWPALYSVGAALNAASGCLGLVGAVWLLVAMLRARIPVAERCPSGRL
jgi:hypothetical protein